MSRIFFNRSSLVGAAAAMLFGVAALAAVSLGLLQKAYRQSFHAAAAVRVVETGRAMAARLAQQASSAKAADWASFGHLVHGLAEAEPSLYYVSVTENGAILYHEQMPNTALPDGASVRIGRASVVDGDATVPVLTFTARTAPNDGAVRSVQVALRRGQVEREEAEAAAALGIMFRVALGTMTAAFLLSVLLVVWVFRRELRRQRRRRVEEHLALAGALADGIIHDVRNPLSALGLDVQMIEREAGKGREARPERLTELAVRARSTIERLDSIMGEFLLVSQPEGRMPEPVDLTACLRDSLDLLGPRFERLEVKLAIDLPTAPLWIAGHAVALKRAFVNLLVNAEQASPRGGVVTVRATRDGQAGVVEISDQGRGIPRAERKRVFEMFVTQRPGGLGLGLSLAKSAIESCGGSVEIADAPYGGARFVLRFRLNTD